MAGWIKIPLGTEVGLGPGDFVSDRDPALLPKKGAEPPIFGPCLLWLNGCMYWHGGRPQPKRHCVRWGPSSPPLKRHAPNFRPMSVVAKRLDGLRCHGRPQPRRLFVRWGPSSYQKNGTTPTQFLAHVYVGQTAEWIKMPVGTEVNLGPGDVVLDGVAAPH